MAFILLCYWPPAIALLKLYPRKSHQHAEEIAPFLNAMLTKIWIQLMCPFMDGWMGEWMDGKKIAYIFNRIPSVMRRMKFYHLRQTIWRKLKTLC